MLKYKWEPATGPDIEHIVKMAEEHFQNEIDNFFKPQPVAFARNLTHAVVNQYYSPETELLSVCKDDTGKLLAYTWCDNQEVTVWSDDRMVAIKMAHVDLTLSTRQRINLVKDMMELWEGFAYFSHTPVICSTTMRKEQDSFLKLHQKNGYEIRGSFAYKRVSTTQATPAN